MCIMGSNTEGCGCGKSEPNLDNVMKKNGTFLFAAEPNKVEKGWGYELIFHSDDEYCGKVLHFNKGAKFSMHYHIDKRETWYVSKGKLVLRYLDSKIAKSKELVLEQGSIVIINRGFAHQLVALEESDVFEVSTPDDPEDSYRVEKGDSQTNTEK
jgi:mannose-6-phosphate isomerase-like protein (cupin superfamily)